MSVYDMPDDHFEQPTAFSEAKHGWHSGALNLLPKAKLSAVMDSLGVDTVDDACKAICNLDEAGYLKYLGMLSEE